MLHLKKIKIPKAEQSLFMLCGDNTGLSDPFVLVELTQRCFQVSHSPFITHFPYSCIWRSEHCSPTLKADLKNFPQQLKTLSPVSPLLQ